ncbi:unnamed protein product, partial [Amoebophrya sp. A120]|eukprot:GSA120T00013216001.1
MSSNTPLDENIGSDALLAPVSSPADVDPENGEDMIMTPQGAQFSSPLETSMVEVDENDEQEEHLFQEEDGEQEELPALDVGAEGIPTQEDDTARPEPGPVVEEEEGQVYEDEDDNAHAHQPQASHAQLPSSSNLEELDGQAPTQSVEPKTGSSYPRTHRKVRSRPAENEDSATDAAAEDVFDVEQSEVAQQGENQISEGKPVKSSTSSSSSKL